MNTSMSTARLRNLGVLTFFCALGLCRITGQNFSSPQTPIHDQAWDPGKLGETLLHDPVWV